MLASLIMLLSLSAPTPDTNVPEVLPHWLLVQDERPDAPQLTAAENNYLIEWNAWHRLPDLIRKKKTPPPIQDRPLKEKLEQLFIYSLLYDYEGKTKKLKLNISSTLRCLAYYDPERAKALVDTLPLWEHSEHFLERLPEYLLTELVHLQWRVAQENLDKALTKLKSLLPTDSNDMIDCAADKLYGQILYLICIQQGQNMLPRLLEERESPYEGIEYGAILSLLYLDGIPIPTISQLVENYYNVYDKLGFESLTPKQQMLCLCILVDEGARDNNFLPWLEVADFKQACDFLKELELEPVAKTLHDFLSKDGETWAEEDLRQAASETYRDIDQVYIRLKIARWMLNNKEELNSSQK